MSTETPVIRNFLGLEGLERICTQLRLQINLGYGNVIEIEPSEVAPIAPGDLRDIGVNLQINSDSSAVLQAIGEAGLRAEDVSLFLIAESGFLKNRDLFNQVSAIELGESISVVQWKSPRQDSMNDRRHGFDLHVVFALNKHIKHVPLRPRRLGTVLAESSFSIRPTKIGSGFVPQPLTDEVRGNQLPKGTVLWVEPVGELFEAESLDEAIAIYIDEEIHADIGTLRTKESKLIQTKLALEALAQIVFLASSELSTRDIGQAEEQSVIGRYLFSQLQKVAGSNIKDPHEALLHIKSNPALVAAQFTSQARLKLMLRTLLRGEGD